MLRLAALGDRLEYAELLPQLLCHLHDGGHVVAPVAVVGGRPDRHQVPRVEPELEPFLHQLMRPGDQLQPVYVVEVPHHLCPEDPPGPPVVGGPRLDVLGVGPHQVAKRA